MFCADTTLETFGRGPSGWFWWPRRRGFAPNKPAHGPFPTSYSAYRDALRRRTDPRQFGERSPGFRLCADRAGACMRQGAAEHIASEAARAAARAEPNSVKNLLEYQLLVPTIGGEGVHQQALTRLAIFRFSGRCPRPCPRPQFGSPRSTRLMGSKGPQVIGIRAKSSRASRSHGSLARASGVFGSSLVAGVQK